MRAIFATVRGKIALTLTCWLRPFLPPGWEERVWSAFIQKRLEEMRRYLPDEALVALASDLTYVEREGREERSARGLRNGR